MPDPLFHPRPAVGAALGALLGSLVFAYAGMPLLPVLAAAGIAAGLWLFLKKKNAFALPLFFGAVLLASLLLPETPAPGETAVTGRVSAMPESEGTDTVLTLDRLTLNGKRTRGSLLVTAGTNAALGDTVSLTAFVSPAAPGASLLLGTAKALDMPVVTPYRGGSPYIFAVRLRNTLETVAARLFPGYEGEAQGLLLGDRSNMRYLSYRAYKNSGLMHLMCVSGLHVGIVAGAVLSLIRGRKKWLRLLLAALFLLVYTALTGFTASALRAALMLLGMKLQTGLDRQKDPLSAMALAFSLLLVYDPLYAQDAGFQLSFAAVFGILCLTKPLMKPVPEKWRPVVSPFAASLAAMLGTAPLLAGLNGELQWAGLLLSPFAIPAVPYFLIPGWLAVLAYTFSPALARLIAYVPRGVLIYLGAVTELGTAKSLSLPAPGALTLLFWFAGLLFLSPLYLPNRRRPPYEGWALIAGALAAWLLRMV